MVQRPSNWPVHRAEGECSLSFMVVLFLCVFFFSTLVFLFIILGQVFCPRATCPLRPPECWPALEVPEADQNLRYPYGYDSAGWTPVTAVERELLPSMLFSWTCLEGLYPAGCLHGTTSPDDSQSALSLSQGRVMVERGRCPFSAEFSSKGVPGPCCNVTMECGAQSCISL